MLEVGLCELPGILSLPLAFLLGGGGSPRFLLHPLSTPPTPGAVAESSDPWVPACLLMVLKPSGPQKEREGKGLRVFDSGHCPALLFLGTARGVGGGTEVFSQQPVASESLTQGALLGQAQSPAP